MERSTPPASTNSVLLRTLMHDLLTPLTSIRWNTELMLGSQRLVEEKTHAYLEDIHESCKLGILITHRITGSIQLLEGHFPRKDEECELGAAIGGSVEELRAQYERHGVNLTYQSAAGSIVFDPRLVEVLVWAFLKYFLSYAPQGASVRLSLEPASGTDNAFRLTGTLEFPPESSLAAEHEPEKAALNGSSIYMDVLRAALSDNFSLESADEFPKTPTTALIFTST